MNVVEGVGFRGRRRRDGGLSLSLLVTLGRGMEARAQTLETFGQPGAMELRAEFAWAGEDVLEFLMVSSDGGSEVFCWRGSLLLASVMQGDWRGSVRLLSETEGEDAAGGDVHIELQWPSADSDGGAGPLPGGALGETGHAQVDSEAGKALREYASKLSELVAEQHAARQDDWSEFRAWEASLVQEVLEGRCRKAEEPEQLRKLEARLEGELRAERRRRIGLEAQLTVAEQRQKEGAGARQSSQRVAQELREVNRQLEMAWEGEAEALVGEERAMAGMQRVELSAETRYAGNEYQLQTRQAEVLGVAWELSDELQAELDAYRSEQLRLQSRAYPNWPG